MNRALTLKRLNREKEYEDKLVETISKDLLTSLSDIQNLTSEEKDFLNKQLTTVLQDSVMHSRIFDNLMNYVLENGEDNY